MKKLLIIMMLGILASSGVKAEPDQDQILDQRISWLEAKVPASHPRLLILKEEVPRFRQFIADLHTTGEYPELTKAIRFSPKNKALPREPQVRKISNKSATGNKLWREDYKTAFATGSTAQRYAFAYLVTGENHYGRAAARWLNHWAKWDPQGGTSLKANDEAFIQSLRPMLFAYDWAESALTAKERRSVKRQFQMRLQQLYEHITNKFSLTAPTALDNSLSHPLRFVATLGLGGLVLYGEIPEAATYLAWAYEYYQRQFPVWGGAEGGWAEGLQYWQTGNQQHWLFYEALRTIDAADFLQRDFYRNNGYFALYNYELYPFASFGDLANTLAPNPNVALLMDKYALLYNDSYLARYAQLMKQPLPKGISYNVFSYYDSLFHLYRKGQTQLLERSLRELPRSRLFKDVGWVTFHTDLERGPDDIMFALKSSPFGSVSHSFSDQNSFVLNAFGEQLAISSGYREWYGSPHHLGWTRTTHSKNAILFGGQGQPLRDPQATGEITRFYTGGNFDFATGSAAQAYKNLGVEQALRHVLFVDQSYLVILDELAGETAVTHQWLLHAKSRPQMLPQCGIVEIIQNQAGLLTQFLVPAPTELSFKLTDEFAIAPHPDYVSRMPREWHVTAEAVEPAKTRNFLTWLFPYQLPGEIRPEVIVNQTELGYNLVIATSEQQADVFMAREAEGAVFGNSGSLQGLAGLVIMDQAGLKSFALVEGSQLCNTAFHLSATTPVTVWGQREGNLLNLEVDTDHATEIRLDLSVAPSKVEGQGIDVWYYEPAEQTLVLSLSGKAVLTVE